MALSRYTIFSYSSEQGEVIENSTEGLEVVDFVKDFNSESQFANGRYDSIPLKILTSFFYIIEVIAAMIMFSFVYYERSGAAGYYRTVINQLVACCLGAVSFFNRGNRTAYGGIGLFKNFQN